MDSMGALILVVVTVISHYALPLILAIGFVWVGVAAVGGLLITRWGRKKRYKQEWPNE